MRAGYAIALLSIPFVTANYQYNLNETIIGRDFFDAFQWESEDDYTHGRVNYVDKDTAIKSNYSYASDTKFVMAPNSCDVVQPGARGRDSVRISSYRAYDEVVIALDIQHMPQGCGTWPAFWTNSKVGPWPHGGEIDIIEGVNSNMQNQATLHTTGNCTMPVWRSQTGTTLSDNCDVQDNNIGCGTRFASTTSYGADFNNIGGGWYVMRKARDHGVSVWFWDRNDPLVPPEIRDGCQDLVTTQWRPPDADFPMHPDNCDYDKHFDAHQIIFDLTFCGDWAGSAYPTSGCPSTCNDFVDNHPHAFVNAYWEINSLRIYTLSPSYW